jgi:mannose-6-phosphate isomerase class I
MSVLQLRACVKTYDWGVVGDDSQVAQFALASPPFQVEKSTPYAEVFVFATV